MRERWIDETRGYALLLVVFGHMGISYFGQYFTSCHLPIFYFLSGYLFSTRDKFPLFVKKKMKRLLIPYFCFGAILLTSSLVMGGVLSELLVKFAVQKRMYTIWFLTSLFFVNIIFYWITKLTRGKSWVIMAISLMMYISGVFYYKNGGQPLFWNIDTVLVATIWFAAGFVLKNSCLPSRLSQMKNQKRNTLLMIAFSGITYLSVVFINWEYCHEKFDIAMRTMGIPLLTLSATFAGIIMFMSVARLIQIGFVNYLGRNTMVYFALHQTVMIPLLGWVYASLGLFTQESMTGDLIRLVLSIFLIFACLYPIEKLLNHSKLKFMLGL